MQQHSTSICFHKFIFPYQHYVKSLHVTLFSSQNVKNTLKSLEFIAYSPLPSPIYDKDLLNPISPTKQPFVFPDGEICPGKKKKTRKNYRGPAVQHPCAANFVSRKLCRYVLQLTHTPRNYTNKYCTDTRRLCDSLVSLQQPNFISLLWLNSET